MKLRLLSALVIAAAAIWLAEMGLASSNPAVVLPDGLPPDLWSYFVPLDNPMTVTKVELGRELFFDKRLSSDGTVSCATCHDPQLGFADGKRTAEGVAARRGARNSPTLLNAMFNAGQFWDGRSRSLEDQAIQPLINADEMGNRSYDQVVERIRLIPEYRQRFGEVFAAPPTIALVGKAVAAYERTLVSGASPFDRFATGTRDAMSDSALRGMALFRGNARCTTCHTIGQFLVQSYPFFSDQLYHNTGVATNEPAFTSLSQDAIRLSRARVSSLLLQKLALDKGAASLGRFLVTGNALDIGAFRTPSLRNVELTAPYFHDGSAETLADVVKFYTKGGKATINRDWELQPITLSDRDQADIVEFLKSLTSENARQFR